MTEAGKKLEKNIKRIHQRKIEKEKRNKKAVENTTSTSMNIPQFDKSLNESFDSDNDKKYELKHKIKSKHDNYN